MRELVVAELESPDAAVLAARCVRDLGYGRVEAYTPFPIPELDDALAVRRTRTPWLILLGGFAGAGLALLVLWWTNAYDYPIDVGGRPLFSAPSDMPIVFEMTVLSAALVAFAAALLAARLPRLHDPVFDLAGFGRTKIDRFWVVVGDAFLMTADIEQAEQENDERRAALLRSVQEEKLAELASSLERIGATVKRATLEGALR